MATKLITYERLKQISDRVSKSADALKDENFDTALLLIENQVQSLIQMFSNVTTLKFDHILEKQRQLASEKLKSQNELSNN